jgi:hypothetical protein
MISIKFQAKYRTLRMTCQRFNALPARLRNDKKRNALRLPINPPSLCVAQSLCLFQNPTLTLPTLRHAIRPSSAPWLESSREWALNDRILSLGRLVRLADSPPSEFGYGLPSGNVTVPRHIPPDSRRRKSRQFKGFSTLLYYYTPPCGT